MSLSSNFWKLYVVNFLVNLQFFGAVSVPFYLDWASLDYTKIFLLQAWFVFWWFILEVPTGYFADRFGRKFSVVLGLFLSACAMFIYGFVNSYFAFFVAEFIGAFAVSCISGADSALLYDSLKQAGKSNDASRVLARYDSAGKAGLLVGFPVGSLIAGSFYPGGLPVTFLLTGIFMLFAVIVGLFVVEPERRKLSGSFVKEGINGFLHLFKHRSLRALALNYSVIGALVFFMFWFYQSLLGLSGVDVMWYGFVSAGFNLFGILLLLNVRFFERFGISRVLFFSSLIPGLLFVSLFFFKSLVFVLVCIFVITGFAGLRRPVLSDFMNRHIESANRATVLSGVSMFEKGVRMLLYLVVGLLSDISVYYALLVLGVLIIVFSIVCRVESVHTNITRSN